MSSTYTTRSGDTWDAVAYRALGSERYMPQVIEANPLYQWTVRFDAGVALTIPDIDPADSVAAELPPWRQP